MTQEQVHNAICDMPDTNKRTLAIQCQLNGVDPIQLEKTIADLITCVENISKQAISNYKYWS